MPQSPAPFESVTVLAPEAEPIAVVKQTGLAFADLPALMDAVFTHLMPTLAAQGVELVGAPLSYYTRLEPSGIDVQVGFPIAEESTAALSEPLQLADTEYTVELSHLPESRVAAHTYMGGYDGLGGAWQSFLGQVAERGLVPTKHFWEVYVTEPTADGDPALNRTDLFIALDNDEDGEPDDLVA
ncbi:AraC family transcriptional regulator [Helcobacillus sp. ACRRO]|uniref:AraC family transcriptional regulator n=1 Tax=Helcobacillus sp. ACRRO TaxID=2918202 RepID=UPI001EF6822E|nr:AraC family transcriptional regulator [Helcobacillus sp. ACRRO]MCG7426659.1 AraC family transcriptional regulator [Helcobacillus sp. ACRRO]